MESDFRNITRALPSADMIVGYGSGVFQQAGESSGCKRLIDLIIFTPDRQLYYEELFQHRIITKPSYLLSGHLDPEICFFSDINIQGAPSVKLGVVQSLHAIDRLNSWSDSLYIPGRFHKPTKILSCETGGFLEHFESVQNNNIQAALCGSLLFLNASCNKEFGVTELFDSLVSISYHGDIRMNVAENPRKVQNIRRGQLELLLRMYRPLFGKVGIHEVYPGKLVCSRTNSELWNMLPKPFTRSAIQLQDPHSAFLATICRINKRESIKQALLGVGTTGLLKSFRYLARKVSKRIL
jgi:hypothetical protein